MSITAGKLIIQANKVTINGSISGGELHINSPHFQMGSTGNINVSSMNINNLPLAGDSSLSKRLKKAVSNLGGDLKQDAETHRIKLTPKNNSSFTLNNENIQELMKVKAVSDEDKKKLEFLRAIVNNQYDTVKAMLEADKNKKLIKCNHKGWEALDFACHKNCFEIAYLLVEYGADIEPIDEGCKSPLDRFKEEKHAQELRNLKQSILLSLAASADDTEELRKLLAQDKSQLNRVFTYKGKKVTPLHFACHANAKNAIKLLVKAGADITIALSKNKKTALDILNDKEYANRMRVLGRRNPGTKHPSPLPSRPSAINADETIADAGPGPTAGTAVDAGHSNTADTSDGSNQQRSNSISNESSADKKHINERSETGQQEIINLCTSLNGMKHHIIQQDASQKIRVDDIHVIEFKGEQFIVECDKGQLALLISNPVVAGPAKLSVGVRNGNFKCVLLIAQFITEDGYDFLVHYEEQQKSPPKAVITILKTTAIVNYHEAPCLGIHQNGKKIENSNKYYFNCTAEDQWKTVDSLLKPFVWSANLSQAELCDLAKARLNGMNTTISTPRAEMLSNCEDGVVLQRFIGHYYNLTADQGRLAIKGTNVCTGRAGVAWVGVRAPHSRQIMKIAEIEKTEGHDFHVDIAQLQSQPPRAKIGVYRTPANYDLNPILGFQDKERRCQGNAYVNCNENDNWHDMETVFKRCHSPTNLS